MSSIRKLETFDEILWLKDHKENEVLKFEDDGFEDLWNATSATMPSLAPQHTADFLISEQKEEILCLKDELDFIRNQNIRLKEEMIEFIKKIEFYEKIAEDYTSLLELNRCLTKQLNSVMDSYKKNFSQLEAIKDILLLN